jgi:4-hydroxybenzoate polyprenyltransferase
MLGLTYCPIRKQVTFVDILMLPYMLGLTYCPIRKQVTFVDMQSARITTAFDLPAYSTNGENLVVTNLHSTNFP